MSADAIIFAPYSGTDIGTWSLVTGTGTDTCLLITWYKTVNPFKPSGAKWLHYKVFKAIPERQKK